MKEVNWRRIDIPAILGERDVWVGILAVTTIFAFVLNFIGLIRGISVVTPHLFYLPIVIAGYWFPRRGILFSVIVGMTYLAMVYLMTYPDINSITSATARFYVLVAIGVIVASLSNNLKEKEDRYHGIFDYSEAGVFLVHYNPSDMMIEEVNERGADLLGYRPKELIGRPLFDIWPDKDEKELFTNKIAREVSLSDFESTLQCKDGKEIMVLISAGRLPDRMMVFTITDITQRKQAEEALVESKERYQGLYNNAQAGLVRFRIIDGKVLEANDHMARMFGYDESKDFIESFVVTQNVVNEGVYEYLVSQLLKQDSVSNFEASFKKKDGNTIWIRFWSRIFPDKGYIEAVLTDITEEKHSTRALGESETRYKSLVQNIPDYVMVFSHDRILFANPAAARAIGLNQEELADTSIFDFIAPECQALVKRNIRRTMNGESVDPYEIEIRVPGKPPRITIINTTLLKYHDHSAILAVLTDITEWKQAEEALKASKYQYRTTIDALSDGIYLVDSKLRLFLINPIFRQLLEEAGVNGAVIGKTVDEVLPSLKEGLFEDFHKVFSTGKMVISTEEMQAGKNRYILETRKIPVFEDGVVVKAVTIMRNITKQKQIEEEKRIAYEQIEKNIEQFAILGDHIRNPMQVIVGLADLEGGLISEKIHNQALEIDRTISQLDRGWIESEKIREFVKKYYGIGK
ncbi:MAG TPA: PAS domain S-box protein [Methanoregulaceae archaeon]|nr:PAS domain S-box protein [Methanoregulaceae archaeon]